MDVSIIIVNYNTISLLCDAIDSVLEKTADISYEIIVVDNNSPDNSENIIQQKYIDKVIYIKLNENIGFGRANNEGIKYAKGRNIFLLNPDTVLINNAVKILSKYLDQNADVGVCGGNLYDENNQPALSFVRTLPSVWQEISCLLGSIPEKIAFGKNRTFNYTNTPMKVSAIIGADIMIRKSLLDKIGAFDTDFFMYHEELELCFRVKKSNSLIMSVPQAKIIHLEGKSLNSDMERERRKLIGKNLYFQKTHTKIYHKIVNLIFYCIGMSRLIIFGILGKKEQFKLWLFRIKYQLNSFR